MKSVLALFSVLHQFFACTEYVTLALVMLVSGTFLRAFAELRKAPVTFVMPVRLSVRPSVSMYQL
jgi:hypothetical protein